MPIISNESITSLVIAILRQIKQVDRVERVSDDSARVVLKTGQTFTVAVIHGEVRQSPKEEASERPKRSTRTF